MQSLEGKQRYLREKIPESQYEDFFAYLEEHVGNEDIERWSEQFVVEIVQDFLSSRDNDSSPLETSFYHYQHANDHPQPAPIASVQEAKVKGQGSRQKQDPPKAKQEPLGAKSDLKISKAETASMDVKPSSALHLFDSVFDSTNKPAKGPPAPKPSGKPGGDAAKFNAFDSSEFWSSAGVSKGSNANNKLSKSNVDFTSFDFWSQPQPKNAQEFKTVLVEPPLSSRVQPANEMKNSVIPSFDELIMQMKEEIKEGEREKGGKGEKEGEKEREREKEGKAPSPYQKKSYPQQRSATPAISIVKVPYEGEAVFRADFKDSVKCFPSAERQELKGKELSVAIEGHQIVNRTFLMPDYVMYSLRVQPLNTLVQRNYEDFTRLRALLAEFFPGTKLAHLEGTSWFGATAAEQVKRQKTMLEFFLNDLLRNREVRNSRFLEDFLTLPDHKRIKRKFEEFERLERPKAIEELCLLQGRVHVNLSEQQRQYQEHLRKYQERLVDFLDREERLSAVLAEQYRALGSTLEAMVELTTGILEETRRFNERVFGLEVAGVEEAFEVVRGCYAEEKKLAGFNLDLLTDSQLPFLAYERCNTKELDALIANQQAFLRSYLRRSEAEKADSAVPYTSDKLAYSKAGVAVESRNITVLKYQAGFFGNQLCHEAKRTFEALALKFRELWARTALRKREQCLRSLDFWKTLHPPPPPFS